MTQVSGNTIGQGTFKGIPDKFIGVEFWRISGKMITMQPGMLTDEFSDRGSFMRGTAVPEQYHGPTQVLEQMSEKLSDLGSFNIPVRIKTGIKSDSSSFLGDTDSRDSRNLLPSICTTQDRSLSSWRPSSDNVRNEQEPTFVEEHQVSSEFLGFFLYSATWCFSNMQSPARPVPALSFLAFDNSSQAPLGIAIGGLGDKKCQSGILLLPLPCVESRDRSYIRNSSLLSVTFVSIPVFAVGLIWVVSQTPVSASRRWSLSSDILSTSGKLNLRSILISGTLPADFSFFSVTGQPAGAASPVASGFQKVSCISVYNILNIFSITYA